MKLIIACFLLIVGGASALVGQGFVEKKNAGEDVTLASEITDCISQGGGFVKGIKNDAFHVISETEFADGRMVKNPISGKQWMVISQANLGKMLSDAWQQGQDGDVNPYATTQPVEAEKPSS